MVKKLIFNTRGYVIRVMWKWNLSIEMVYEHAKIVNYNLICAKIVKLNIQNITNCVLQGNSPVSLSFGFFTINRFGCQSNIPGLQPRYEIPVEAKKEQNNSLKVQNTAQSQKSKKGFQPKKKQHTTASQKPPGVKRLRGKGKYYKAFGIDMRAASAHLPDNEEAYGYVEKDSLLTCLDPVAGLFFPGDLPWECICDMWLYFRMLKFIHLLFVHY